MITKPNFEIYTISNWDDYQSLINYVNDNEFQYLVVDTETDGLNEKIANIYGIGLTFNGTESFYIPIRKKDSSKYWSNKEEQDIINFLEFILTSYKIIGHNILYDYLIIKNNFNINFIDNIYSDTMLQKHTLEEEPPFGLKEISVRYLGDWANKAQEALYENIKLNGGKTTKENMEIFKADTNILAEYCCNDVLLTFMLFEQFQNRLQQENLSALFYDEEVMPLYKEVTIPMKDKGFPIDVEYFNKLNENITKDIQTLEAEISIELEHLTQEFEEKILNEEVEIKLTGNFPKILADHLSINLPTNKQGKITIAKKEIEKIRKDIPDQTKAFKFYQWLCGERDLDFISKKELLEVRKKVYGEDKIFNLKSNDHLGWIFFSKYKESPISKTEKGKPQVDDDFIESMTEKYSWTKKLIDYKKLIKLKSTYIEGILDRQTNGYIHTSMLQHGTTSGRFSSRNPNLQNIPKVKEDDAGFSELVLKYTNGIKKGFIAPKSYKIIDTDYSSLEPRCFSHVSGDPNLINVFVHNQDIYSAIAQKVYGLYDSSVYIKDENFLGKLYPEKRQAAKTFSLAVTYGAEAGRISNLLKISYEEAQQLIDDYLNAYPGLKSYIESSHKEAKTHGFVKTMLGRIRHLREAKTIYTVMGDKILSKKYAKANNLMDERYKYKNLLNNSTNFKIQGLAAHIINRASIAITREFKKQNINGYIALQIHDELVCLVHESQIDLAKSIIKDKMENTVKISVPLIAEPKVAHNLKDSK